jgi:hypothetical protein
MVVAALVCSRHTHVELQPARCLAMSHGNQGRNNWLAPALAVQCSVGSFMSPLHCCRCAAPHLHGGWCVPSQHC